MARTRNDFIPQPPPWLIEDWFPIGHRCMDTAPEGSFKTIWGCWLAVCIAAGYPVFGHAVRQGPVMLIDEETPETSLNYHLERFSKGIGYRYKDLPIYPFVMEGFRFNRKSLMNDLVKAVNSIKPVFIRMDSLLAMLPGGVQSRSENDSHLGEIIRDDLNRIISPDRSILLAAHSKKFIAELTFDEIKEHDMQSIVRGHGSIVGEGCDTGFIIKKVSENPNPTRFCIITRVRRQAIPANEIKYIEMVEQSYGEGWARLEEIPASKLPPSDQAKELFRLFKIADGRGSYNHSSRWILQQMAFQNKHYCLTGVSELVQRRAINETGPQNWEINQRRGSQCDQDYLKQLDP